MAVVETFSRKSYSGGVAGTEYDLATKVFATSEVTVFVKDTLTGLVTGPLVEGVGAGEYAIVAISGNLDNGVTVTTTDSYLTTQQITLVRSVAETQELELEEGGDLPANELEDALDRGVMIAQQISDGGGRHIQAPVTDASTVTYELPTAELRAGKAVIFASDGSVAVASIADEGGAFTAVNEDTGLKASGGIISGKVDEQTLTFKTGTSGKDFAVKAGGIGATELEDLSIPTTKLASPTGSDTNIVTGTAGADGNVATWNEDGDVVDGGTLGAWVDWTPVVTQGVSTPTFTIDHARWTKTGKVVTVSAELSLTSAGTSGDPIKCTLPVNASYANVVGTGGFVDGSSPFYVGLCRVDATKGVIEFFRGEATDAIGVDPVLAIASGDTLYFNITYEVD